jgi:MoaA/NifB/PqqE/SkfB family radical SAM enzyme
MLVAVAELAQSVSRSPKVPLHALDALWFQVGGTICNLWCTHCFISCSPKNHSFEFLSRESVRRYLAESVQHGVKEYYFTGGEPFMNRELLGILEDTLQYGPASVLSNGLLITPKVAAALRQLAEASLYTLELRLSLDGFTPETNDPIRGKGTFARALEGVKNLVHAGFLPIITCMQSWPEHEHDHVLAGFQKALSSIGYTRPRLKILPQLRLGREAERERSYTAAEFVTLEMMIGYDDHQLLCSSSRIVTDRGVYVCPILVEKPDANLGDTLADSFQPYPLRHQACYTCYLSGAICSNFASYEAGVQ